MYGLYLSRGEQLVDNHTRIYHDQPNCRSWEVYKGILDGRSHGVFNGKVYVTPEAQKTDAKQTNRTLLLSRRRAGRHQAAARDLRRRREVHPRRHGGPARRDRAASTCRAAAFRARRRRRLLTYAFAAEVVEEVTLAPVRAELDRLVHARLGRRSEAER